MTELILSTRSHTIQGLTNGFRQAYPTEVKQLLSQSELWFGPRPVLESNSDFRQIIPYVVVVNGGKIVAYERDRSSSETRLHGQLSIGLGGHVGLEDVVTNAGQLDAWQTVLKAADRELNEELSQLNIIEKQWHGFVADDATPVGRVHLGIVAIFISRSRPSTKETAVRRPRLLTMAALAAERNELEPWSAIILAALLPQLTAAIQMSRDK